MNAVEEHSSLLHPEPLHCLEVVLPVPAAHDECREAPPVEHPGRDGRLQERADRDVRRKPPCRGADDDEVVFPFGDRGGDSDPGRRRRSSAGIIPSTSRNGCGIGKLSKRLAYRGSWNSMTARWTSQPRRSSTSDIASTTFSVCLVYVK